MNRYLIKVPFSGHAEFIVSAASEAEAFTKARPKIEKGLVDAFLDQHTEIFGEFDLVEPLPVEPTELPVRAGAPRRKDKGRTHSYCATRKLGRAGECFLHHAKNIMAARDGAPISRIELARELRALLKSGAQPPIAAHSCEPSGVARSLKALVERGLITWDEETDMVWGVGYGQ